MPGFFHASRSSRLSAALAAIGLLLAVHGCGSSSSSTSVAPSSISRCSVSVTGGGSPIPADGGAGTLTVTVDRECSWSARSESPWISLTGGQGQGSATISFSVQANPNASGRRGNVAVEQQKVEIAQEAAPCRFGVSPSSVDAAAAGGTVAVGVSAPSGCSWTAQTASPWLTVEPGNGQGGGTVQIAVAPNGAAARSGSVTIAGAPVQVRQLAASGPPSPPSPPGLDCRFDVGPTRRTVEAPGDTFTVDIKAKGGCGWTAASQAPWIIVASGASGTGNGEVRLVVVPNIGESRTGSATVAGASITIQQEAAPCRFGVSPSSVDAAAAGGTVAIGVSAPGGCSWTAQTANPWLSVEPGNGQGGGTVQITVAPNGAAARSGSVTVAGAPVQVRQLAASGPPSPPDCRFDVGPTRRTVEAPGDTFTVDIKAKGGCGWTAASQAPWIIVASGASGTGNGEVRLVVVPNIGESRTGSATVAGASITIQQDGVAECNYTLKPTHLDAKRKSDDYDIDVKTRDGCRWTASSPVSWVTIKDVSRESGTVRSASGSMRTPRLPEAPRCSLRASRSASPRREEVRAFPRK